MRRPADAFPAVAATSNRAKTEALEQQARIGAVEALEVLGEQVRRRMLADAERWLADLRAFWALRLDSLETELARGRRDARQRRDRPSNDRRESARRRRLA